MAKSKRSKKVKRIYTEDELEERGKEKKRKKSKAKQRRTYEDMREQKHTGE